MIYSVDTCVLLDVLLPDPVHGVSSREVLKSASVQGSMAICAVVYAELCPQFNSRASLDVFLSETGIDVLPFSREVLWKAGKVWKEYAARAGTTGPYAGSLDAMGWYWDNSGKKNPCGSRKRPAAPISMSVAGWFSRVLAFKMNAGVSP